MHPDRQKGSSLASPNELAEFLASVERRAYKQALFAVRDSENALDIVQDSMLKLAEKYGAKPLAELPMLFQRILQNTIRDFYRRQKVRSLWVTLFSSLSSGKEDDDADPLETLASADDSKPRDGPDDRLEQSQLIEIIEFELRRLPARQRQAFLLRYWEELDVAETAAVMGCSEGSVKTHCSRATHTLAHALKADTDRKIDGMDSTVYDNFLGMEHLHDAYDRMAVYAQSKRAGLQVSLSYVGKLELAQNYRDFRLQEICDISAMMEPTPANLIAIYSFAGQFHFSLASDESSLPYAQALQIKEQVTATLLACLANVETSAAIPAGTSSARPEVS